MDNWTLRGEVCHRCILVARHGELPSDVGTCNYLINSFAVRQPVLSLLFAPFEPTKRNPPPSESGNGKSLFRGPMKRAMQLLKEAVLSRPSGGRTTGCEVDVGSSLLAAAADGVSMLNQSHLQLIHSLFKAQPSIDILCDLCWALILRLVAVPMKHQAMSKRVRGVLDIDVNSLPSDVASTIPSPRHAQGAVRPSSAAPMRSLHSTKGKVCRSEALAKNSNASLKAIADRPVNELLCEFFSAALRPTEEELDLNSLMNILDKLCVTAPKAKVIEVLQSIGHRVGNSPRAGGQGVGEDAESASSPLRSASTCDLKNSSFMSNSDSQDLSSPRRRSSRHSVLSERSSTFPSPVAAAGMKSSALWSVPPDELRVSESEFLTWLSVAQLGDMAIADLEKHADQFAKRAASTFQRALLSPFSIPTGLRDLTALPLCRLYRSVAIDVIRASCCTTRVGPETDESSEMCPQELQALSDEAELLITEWLLGVSIKNNKVPQSRPSTATIADKDKSRQGIALRTPVPPPSAPKSSPAVAVAINTASAVEAARVHFTGFRGRRDGKGNFQLTTQMELDMEQIKSSLGDMKRPKWLASPRSGAKDNQGRLANSNGGGAPSPGSSPKSDQQRNAGKSFERLLDSLPHKSVPYNTLEALLMHTDAEVTKELKGKEADIHRASALIQSQQRIAVQFAKHHHTNRGTPELDEMSLTVVNEGERQGPRTVVDANAKLLQVAENFSKGKLTFGLPKAPSSSDPTTSIFEDKRSAPMSPRDRFRHVTAHENREPVAYHTSAKTARPVGDITSATSQRTIAKHARRLHQQVEEEHTIQERQFEKEVLFVAKQFDQLKIDGHRSANITEEETNRHRNDQLKEIKVKLDRLLEHPQYLHAKKELRYMVLDQATQIGKEVRAIGRMEAVVDKREARERKQARDADDDASSSDVES